MIKTCFFILNFFFILYELKGPGVARGRKNFDKKMYSLWHSQTTHECPHKKSAYSVHGKFAKFHLQWYNWASIYYYCEENFRFWFILWAIQTAWIFRVSQKTWEFRTNSISSLLWVRIVLPNLKSHNIMSARIYFLKTVKDCEDVSILPPQVEQQRRTSLLCMYTAMYNR